MPEIGEKEERRSGEDRRSETPHPSPWANPGLWVSITGILLTVCIFMAGLLLSELKSINATMTASLVAAAHQQEKADGLRRDIDELKIWRASQDVWNANLLGDMKVAKQFMADSKKSNVP
jgi:hypothetical protein